MLSRRNVVIIPRHPTISIASQHFDTDVMIGLENDENRGLSRQMCCRRLTP
jgi:hypothetical protein